jgi:hypothetical protein
MRRCGIAFLAVLALVSSVRVSRAGSYTFTKIADSTTFGDFSDPVISDDGPIVFLTRPGLSGIPGIYADDGSSLFPVFEGDAGQVLRLLDNRAGEHSDSERAAGCGAGRAVNARPHAHARRQNSFTS